MKETRVWTRRLCQAKYLMALAVMLYPLSGLAQMDEPMPLNPKFYLSTKKVFQPNEKAQVELETTGVERMEMRVYRLDEPLSYLQTLADPHRPKLLNGKRRFDGADIMADIYRQLLLKSYYSLQDEFNYEGRRVASAVVQTKSGRIRHSLSEPVVKSVPPLEKNPLIYREIIDISEPYGWTYRSIPLPIKERGAYLVEAAAGKVAHTVVIISDISMVVKQDGLETLVYVTKADSGAPVAEAKVTIYDNSKKELASGISDANGLVRLAAVPANSLVYAVAGDDVALADPRFYPASQTSGERLYIFTERPVYKPGQELHFKGMVRNLTDKGYGVPSGSKVTVVSVDPKGNKGQAQTLTLSKNGTFDGSITLPETVTFGVHRLIATYNNADYSGEFTVKAYVKPTYRVTVSTSKKAYHQNDTVSGTITGAYFSGGALAGAKVEYEIFRTKFYIPWWVNADYKWYYNDTEAYNSIREKMGEGSGALDKNGQLPFEYQLNPGDGDYTYEIVATVTDNQDRPIVGRKNFKVTVGEFYLRLLSERLLVAPGEKYEVTVTAADYGQDGLKGQNVEVKLLSNSDDKVVQTEKAVTDEHGNAKIAFTVAEPGVYKIQAVARSSDEEVKAEQLIMVSTGNDNLKYIPEQLQVVVDRLSYKQGDKVKALIVAPFAEGYVLASSEGSKLFDAKVIPVKNNTAYYEVPVSVAEVPNFQVAAATVYKGELFKSNRSVIVPPVDKFLNIGVKAQKDKYLPQDEATVEITVNDVNGKPVAAELAVAVVDEAVYDITPELNLTLEEFFYEKKRNNIRTTFSQLFRFYGYSEDVALALGRTLPPHSFGAEKILASKVRKEFKDTAFWQGIVNTNKNGKAVVKFKLPDNLTSWRVTAWAITQDTALGKGKGSLVTAKDVEVMLSGPAYLVAGDKTTYQVVARNNLEKEAALKISLDAKNGDLSGSAKEAKVAAAAQDVNTYTLSAASQGAATLTAAASGAVSDAMEIAIPVLPNGMEQVKYQGGWLKPQGEGDLDYSFNMAFPDGTDLSTASLHLTAGSAILGTMVEALDYLTTYPYGCVEQTMSGFLPDVIAHQTMQQLKIDDKPLASRLNEYITAGLSRLASMQLWNGSWGWWQNDPQGNTFMTAHVIYGLSMAKRAKVQVPAEMYRNGQQALKDLVANGRDNPNVMAYALYALSLTNDAAVKSQVRKLSGNGGLTVYGKALISLTYSRLGMKQEALAAISDIMGSARQDEENDMLYFGDPEAEVYDWFRDPIETTAAVGRALIAAGGDNEAQIKAIMRWLMAQKQGAYWQSTRDTAAVVYLMADYLGKFGDNMPEIAISAKLNDKALGNVALKGNEIFKKDALDITAKVPDVKQDNQISISGRGGDVVFNSELVFYGSAPVPAMSKTFKVSRDYYEVNTSGSSYEAGSKVTEFKAGKLYMVELTVTPSAGEGKALDYVMVEDPLPAGVEVMDQDNGITINGNLLNQDEIHREIRADKVAYFKTRVSGTMNMRYLVRAVFAGEYTAMPAKASLMYFPKQQGYSASQKITIVK